MKQVAVYPGTFCPPTLGHADIARRALEIFSELIIICSDNPHKINNIFSPEERKELWRCYELPKEIEVLTLNEFIAKRIEAKRIIMIRGIRTEDEFEYEKTVMFLNKKDYGIDKFAYLISDEKYQEISSCKIRTAVLNKDNCDFSKFVSPLIIPRMQEKLFQSKR